MSTTYRPRHAEARLRALAEAAPVVVVSGARQVGKSTLLERVFGTEAEFVVLDPLVDVAGARRDPDLFLDSRGFTVERPRPRRPRLVLDEIQYAPELVPALKRRVDRDRTPGRFLVTGSQQWQVMRALSESLAGRAVFLDLDGFTLAETAGRGHDAPWLERWLADPHAFLATPPPRLDLPYALDEVLWRGSLPGVVTADRDVVPDLHVAYLRTYVERDARLVGGASDWQEFARFARLAAALTAQEVNHAQLGREIGVTPQTAARWLATLSATFQWHEVPAFTRNSVQRISRRPKGYLADVGLAASWLDLSGPTALVASRSWGALFETAVVGELRRQAALLSPRPTLHHFRAHSGAEVDIVIERDGTAFPIEIRATARPTRRDASGLRAFREQFAGLPVAPGLVLAPCETVEALTATDWAMPWDIAAATAPRPAPRARRPRGSVRPRPS
jgi:predicted AAA+ superfamily ATPase